MLLISRTSFGSVVRIMCEVPGVSDEEIAESHDRGTSHRITGELEQRISNRRHGKDYIEKVIFNYIKVNCNLK